MAADNICVRLENALKRHGMTVRDINRMTVIGSDEYGTHYYESFHALYEFKNPIQKQTHCFCGKEIDINCYISDGKYVLALGKDCVKHFTSVGMQTNCTICHKIHRLRNSAKLCGECLETHCKTCSQPKRNSRYPTCYKCYAKSDSTRTKHIREMLYMHDDWDYKELQMRRDVEPQKTQVVLKNITYALKDQAKTMGAKWNPDTKCWWVFSDSEHLGKLLELGK